MSALRQMILLAGGKGTRLASRLNGIPKPLVLVDGVPLLERQIRIAQLYKITRIFILVNHQAAKIRKFCSERNNDGLDIRCIDDGEPLGTAGAVLNILPSLKGDVLVMYGDTLLNVDLDRFYAFHKAHPTAAGTLFLHPNDHPHDSDLVEMDATGLITGIHPYPHPSRAEYSNIVNAALYLLRCDSLREWSEIQFPLDFAKDLFPRMIEARQRLYGYMSPEYIKDIGTPERLDKAEADIRSGRVARASLTTQQIAVFLDRDGTLNKDVGFLTRRDQFQLLPGAATAVRHINNSGLLAIVITNQPVVARGDCDELELNAIHARMETLLGREGAYLDRLYVCTHHPDKGFSGERQELKIQCDCRKPGTALLEQAARDLHIDLSRSWFLGDRTADILCANRAGVRSILLRTGDSGKDGKYTAFADYEAPDILQAVSFLLNAHSRLLAATRSFTETLTQGQAVLVYGVIRQARQMMGSLVYEALKERGISLRRVTLDAYKPSLMGKNCVLLIDCESIPDLQCFPSQTRLLSVFCETNTLSFFCDKLSSVLSGIEDIIPAIDVGAYFIMVEDELNLQINKVHN